MRPIILKLATKISLECGTYTGVTPNDPEYKILDPVLTDEMAEIAMGLRVRHYVTPEEVAKKVKKPLDRVTEVLYELADLFRVFGDSTRIKILYALHDDELCVQDIANAVQLSQSAVSHQLRVLKDSKLVRFRRDGKTIYYALDDDHVRSILSMGMDHIEE